MLTSAGFTRVLSSEHLNQQRTPNHNMTFNMRIGNFEYQWDHTDVVNPRDFIPHGEFNPHNVRPFILHDAGFPVAIVFADCLQDAIDEAVDAGKLDRFQVTESELADYETGERTDVGSEYCPEGYPEYEGLSFLGNASEPFDIESLDAVDICNREWTLEYWTLDQIIDHIDSLKDRWEGMRKEWKAKHRTELRRLIARRNELTLTGETPDSKY